MAGVEDVRYAMGLLYNIPIDGLIGESSFCTTRIFNLTRVRAFAALDNKQGIALELSARRVYCPAVTVDVNVT